MTYAFYAIVGFLAFSGAVFWLGTAYEAYAQCRDAGIERERKEQQRKNMPPLAKFDGCLLPAKKRRWTKREKHFDKAVKKVEREVAKQRRQELREDRL